MTQIPPHIRTALEYGIVKLGHTLEDYLLEAVTENGYETVCIWGVQGSGKSCRALQMAYWIYQDWEEVLKHVIFKPSELVERLDGVPDGERIPCLIFDDIGVHYPSSTFKTDIMIYQAMDSTWAAIRTKLAVIIVTIPVINRLAKNVKDNVTFEVFLGRNQKEIMKRVFFLPGTDRPEANYFKVTVEWPEPFDLYKVPLPIWNRYWEMRLKLTNEAIENLRGVAEPEDADEYVTVWDVAKDVSISANTLQQMGSRGLIPTKRIGRRLFIPKSFLPELEAEYPVSERQ